MTEEEAAQYISALSIDEKRQLNEMLKALEQTHRPFPALPALADIDGK